MDVIVVDCNVISWHVGMVPKGFGSCRTMDFLLKTLS